MSKALPKGGSALSYVQGYEHPAWCRASPLILEATLILTIAFAFSLVSAPAPTPEVKLEGFEEIWKNNGADLQAEGINRAMARAAYMWTELQYHVGICSSYLTKGDLEHWRFWWRNTQLEKGPFGQTILRIGEEGFLEGIADARTRPLTGDHCQRISNSWTSEMRRVLAEAE